MKFDDWKNQPATAKQLEYIQYIQAFAIPGVPEFTGKTKGEAAFYINKYADRLYKNEWAMVNGYD